MLNGKPEGYWRNYYPNGVLKSEGWRKNHLLDSTWVFYNEDGSLQSQINYVADKREGESIQYREGTVAIIANYENGVQQDYTVELYATGEVKTKTFYNQGKAEGKAYEYAPDGRIITLLEYADGNLKSVDRINRYDSNQLKQGKWIEFHANGVVAEEGIYQSGERNGIFKFFDKEGNLLRMELYRNGQLFEDAEETAILDIRKTFYPSGKLRSDGGYNSEGQREGLHKYFDELGELEKSVLYEDGVSVGEGKIDAAGKYQGEWRQFYPDGAVRAEGAYEDGVRVGDWTFYFPNGKVEQKGKYVKGFPQGEWKWYHPNGVLAREEFYRRGKEDGESFEYDTEGKIVTKGNYVSGLREGEWFYELNDHTEKGSYRDGERDGVWKYYYPDGRLSFEGEYLIGLPVGKHRYYHPNGITKLQGKYQNGLREGDWKTYDNEGNLELTVKYKRGEEIKINGTKVRRATSEEKEEPAESNL